MFFGDFPFGGMPNMGGPGGPSRPRGNVDNSKLYEALGVPKDADTNAIKKAYRKLALEHHPDRGGDADKFKEISKAYEVLTDPEKRKTYDEFGEEGLEAGAGGPGGAGFGDIFSSMFGGGGGGGAPRKRRGEDVVHPVDVTLAQLYTGISKKMALYREVLCKTCKGHGSKDGKPSTCGGCNGRGRRMVVQRMGNMIAQQTVTCPDCRGKGSVLQDSNKCEVCNGNCIVKEKELLQVNIEKGMRNGQKITFKGKGDERPDYETGDLLFVVNEQPHPFFKRQGEHLVIEHKITLLEALTGFKIPVTHLDQRQLTLHSVEGKVYKPGDVLVAKGEGMPIYGRSFQSGHLVVRLDVVFPLTIHPEQYAVLASVLPKGAPVTIHKDAEDHYLEDGANLDLSGKPSKQNKTHYDEDGDEDSDEEHQGHGGPQVGCTQA